MKDNEKRLAEIGEIEIFITRKRIKNIYLNISYPDGAVKISAPYHVKDDVIFSFLEEKKAWIKKKQENIKNKKQLNFLYNTGEEHYYLGNKYNLEIVKDKKEGVKIIGSKLMLFVSNISSKNSREKVILKWYRRELERYIIENKDKWESLASRKASEWRIKRMKTRWGSCNPGAKRIWISLDIIKKPKECIDYIMIHELLHFLERGHNRNFYRLLSTYFPHYKIAEKMLKNNNHNNI